MNDQNLTKEKDKKLQTPEDIISNIADPSGILDRTTSQNIGDIHGADISGSIM